MPTYTFVADNETAIPQGYAQRINIAVQQSQPWRDQDGSVKGPDVWAFRRIQQAGVRLYPGVVYRPYLINQEIPPQDQILSVLPAPPAVQQAQVNAPYAEPYGNRGQDVIPMPREGDKSRLAPAGDLEPLPDAALPGNGGDGLYGEIDGFGGTYEDISPTTGIVYKRPTGNERVYAETPMQQRIHQQ